MVFETKNAYVAMRARMRYNDLVIGSICTAVAMVGPEYTSVTYWNTIYELIFDENTNAELRPHESRQVWNNFINLIAPIVINGQHHANLMASWEIKQTHDRTLEELASCERFVNSQSYVDQYNIFSIPENIGASWKKIKITMDNEQTNKQKIWLKTKCSTRVGELQGLSVFQIEIGFTKLPRIFKAMYNRYHQMMKFFAKIRAETIEDGERPLLTEIFAENEIRNLVSIQGSLRQYATLASEQSESIKNSFIRLNTAMTEDANARRLIFGDLDMVDIYKSMAKTSFVRVQDLNDGSVNL
jgi:hypothetical protein